MRVGTGSETDARDAETLVVGLSLAGGPVTLRLLWAVLGPKVDLAFWMPKCLKLARLKAQNSLYN